MVGYVVLYRFMGTRMFKSRAGVGLIVAKGGKESEAEVPGVTEIEQKLRPKTRVFRYIR